MTAPRELFRAAQPFANHNGGQIGFNRLAAPGSPEFGLLYIGLGDGGNGGDPLNVSQNLSIAFGKILRIDPLGKNSTNGRYGIPATNPFVKDGKPDTLKEIYASGVRYGWSGFALLTAILSAGTVAGMVLFTWLTLTGVRNIKLGLLEKYESGLIGGLLCAVGLLIILFEN